MTAPIRITPELPIVRTMQDVVDLFRLMKEHWGLTNVFCDDQGGLTSGHTDKVLGPTEERRLGYDTFALFMELCALEFVPRINIDAVKRMEAIWEQRERPLYPNAKVKRISKKLIERAKPHVMKDTGRIGGLVTAYMRTPAQRSESARKAANSRWRKHRREKRSRTLRKGPAPQLDDLGLPGAIDTHPPRLTPSVDQLPADAR